MLELLSVLVLALLTMVGFSSGVTLAARRREYPVAFVDLVVVVVLWMVMVALRLQLDGLVLFAVMIALGLAAGYGIGVARFAGHDEKKLLPKSELPEHAREKVAAAVPTDLVKRVWRRWNEFAGRMGNVQGRLLMGCFYFFVVSPFGLGVRLMSDPLAVKKAPAHSNWHRKEAVAVTLDAAKEQG